MLKGTGRVYPKGKTLMIYVPQDIVMDAQFPISTEYGSEVEIAIVDRRLVIANKEKGHGKVD